jgi:ATP-binding cassette, subfamily B, multidrug efflux pump
MNRTRLLSYARREIRALAAGLGALLGTNALALSIPWLLKGAIEAIQSGDVTRARNRALIMAGVALVQAGVRVMSRFFILDSARRVEYELRNDLFVHLTTLSPRFFGKATVGDVMSRCVNDLGQVRLLMGPGVMMSSNAIAAYLLGIGFMLAIDVRLTLLALIPYPPLIVLVVRTTKAVYARNKATQEALGELTARIQENLAGQLTVKAYGLGDQERQAFSERNQTHYAASVKLANARSAMMPLWATVSSASAVVVLYAGGRSVAAGTMSLGSLAAYLGYLAALAWPTAMLGWAFAVLERGRSSMARIEELFSARPEVSDQGPGENYTVRGDLELRDLTFSYETNRALALDHLSLRIPKAGKVAVVGATGSGKSTLAALLARLYEVPTGGILIDGQDVRSIPLRSLRRQVVVVPQEPFLFSASIGENIALGRPDAARAEIERVTQVAQLAADVATFPQGLETRVGERGVALSGGQRARVAIARALLMRPKVLVLDDPFAALDAETASHLVRALAKELKDSTVVLVSHRLAAVRDADFVAVLEQGRLVEQGRHDVLLAKHGAYAALWRRERTKEALDVA